jgi:hypothetical protein
MRTLVSAGGAAPDGGAGEPAVSGDGRVVVFTSDATNLVSEPDANGRQPDITHGSSTTGRSRESASAPTARNRWWAPVTLPV